MNGVLSKRLLPFTPRYKDKKQATATSIYEEVTINTPKGTVYLHFTLTHVSPVIKIVVLILFVAFICLGAKVSNGEMF